MGGQHDQMPHKQKIIKLPQLLYVMYVCLCIGKRQIDWGDQAWAY